MNFKLQVDEACGCWEKEKYLEEMIRKAAAELEKTKSSFKSKKIKEVREMLLASIGQ